MRRTHWFTLSGPSSTPYYRDMKDSCNKGKHAWHSAWMEKLDKPHVVYVAKEAYTSYDMYRRIVDMRKCLLPKTARDPAGSRAMASVVATISR